MTLGGVVGVYYDANAHTMGYILPNGTDLGVVPLWDAIASPAYAIAGGDYNFTQPALGWTATANFGASAFTHTVPAGYEAGFGLGGAAGGPGVATADLVAPLHFVEAYGGGTSTLTAPAPVLTATGVLIAQATAYLTSPAVVVSAYGGALAVLTAPCPTLTSQGHDSTGKNDFTYTAPSPALSAYGGASAALSAPTFTLAITGTATNFGAAAIEPPTATITASGTVSATAQAALRAPLATLIGYSGAVVSITLTGSPTISVYGTTGSIGGAQITAPLFELTSTATAQNHGSSNLVAPSARLGAQAQAWIIAPGATLTAIGSAVITVTYKAYALNLKHNAETTDELTRYTNFPFDRIVRYKDRYYGMSSTGLYLLEGTTDFAEPTPTPIPWSWKTTMTDFGTTQLQTVRWAYFGGRMAPAAQIAIHFGDTASESYAYSTPRDTSAQNYRQEFGRGIKSRYYAFSGQGSGEFSLDSINFIIAKSARKV
jgi:hypothetical protein